MWVYGERGLALAVVWVRVLVLLVSRVVVVVTVTVRVLGVVVVGTILLRRWLRHLALTAFLIIAGRWTRCLRNLMPSPGFLTAAVVSVLLRCPSVCG